MSYDSEKIRLGAEPLTVVGLVIDYCTLVEGTDPCFSVATGDTKCQQTYVTCNFLSAYDGDTNSKEFLFCQPRSSLPKGVNMYPVIIGEVEKAGTSTTAGSGLGKRAVVSIKLRDFPHHDRDIDKSIADRSFNPQDQGTFWGKFIARNPYYEGRALKVYYGYIGDTFSLANDFEVQEYDIIDIKGPNNGQVEIIGKDVLVRTYDRKTTYPTLSIGSLLGAITSGATVATLTPAGVGNSDYPASGTLSIGKEAILYTRVNDTLTLVTRATFGTTAVGHAIGDTVQICEIFDENITIALDRILTTGAGLDASYIPTAEWAAEASLWLSSATVFGILMKPESIEKVIGEWSEVFMFDIWHDLVTKTIRIKALSPEPAGVTINTLTELANIKQGSLKIDRQSKNRFTEIRVAYNKIDYSEKNSSEQFNNWQISTDPSRASAERYNGNSVKTIFSRWFIAGANASQLSGRLLARFSDTPEIVTFKLDQKDHGKLELAGRVELDSWQFQDFNGKNQPRKFQVLEINEGRTPGHDFTVKCLTSSFTGRYFFITVDSMVDFSAATDEQKEANGFISLSTGLFADGTEGHKII